MSMTSDETRRRDISLGGLYIKYFWLIAGAMSLLIAITVFIVSTISAGTQDRALDKNSLQSLTLIQSSLDSVLGDTATQANKLAYSEDIVQMRLMDRNYAHDYEAMTMRLRSLKYLRLAQRANLDYNIALYIGVNDYIISTKNSAQKRQYVFDNEITDVYAGHWAQGETQFFMRRNICTGYEEGNRKWVLSYFYGIGEKDFLVVDIDIDKLAVFLNGGDSAAGSVALVLDDAGGYLLASAPGWEDEACDWMPANVGIQAAVLDDYAINEELYRIYICQSTAAHMVYTLLVPYETRRLEMQTLIRSLAVVLLIALIMSLILAWIISKRVFKPIGVILDFVNSRGSDTPDMSGSYEVRHILLNILEAYQRNTRLEKQQLAAYAKMRFARVRALQQQMTPHFLYNTLQAILWMTMEDMGYQESRSSESIKSLSHMARFCMEGGTIEVSLQEEIDYVEEYLRLMKLRYGEKIHWSLNLSDGAAAWKIPRLSIQPLVENAVRHGVVHTENGRLEIGAALTEDGLRVCVRDNGPGMTDEDMTALRHEFEKEFTMNDRHIALLNLNQRLKLIYGPKAGLYIDQREGMMEIGFTIQ